MKKAPNRLRHALHRACQGVTLVELLITLAIAAILLAVAVPGFQSFIIGNRLTTQSNELFTGLQFARNEAIRLNRPVHFCRATSASATTCAGGTAGTDTWANWIVIAPGLTNPLLRSGSVNTANNMVVLASSNLVNNTLVFGSDSLAREVGDPTELITGAIRICAPVTSPSENSRLINIVGGGRAVTAPHETLGTNGCTAPNNPA